MATRAREMSDSAQHENVELESQKTVDEAAQAEIVEVEVQQPISTEVQRPIDDDDAEIDTPFGAKIRSGTGRNRASGTPPEPQPQTFVSGVNNGAHLNIYLAAILYAMARPWEHGVNVKWRFKNGKPWVIRLRRATGRGYNLRARPAQRPHFTIPTARVGGALSGFDAVEVESWVDDDDICIRLPTRAFADGEGQP